MARLAHDNKVKGFFLTLDFLMNLISSKDLPLPVFLVSWNIKLCKTRRFDGPDTRKQNWMGLFWTLLQVNFKNASSSGRTVGLRYPLRIEMSPVWHRLVFSELSNAEADYIGTFNLDLIRPHISSSWSTSSSLESEWLDTHQMFTFNMKLMSNRNDVSAKGVQ